MAQVSKDHIYTFDKWAVLVNLKQTNIKNRTHAMQKSKLNEFLSSCLDGMKKRKVMIFWSYQHFISLEREAGVKEGENHTFCLSGNL